MPPNLSRVPFDISVLPSLQKMCIVSESVLSYKH